MLWLLSFITFSFVKLLKSHMYIFYGKYISEFSHVKTGIFNNLFDILNVMW